MRASRRKIIERAHRDRRLKCLSSKKTRRKSFALVSRRWQHQSCAARLITARITQGREAEGRAVLSLRAAHILFDNGNKIGAQRRVVCVCVKRTRQMTTQRVGERWHQITPLFHSFIRSPFFHLSLALLYSWCRARAQFALSSAAISFICANTLALGTWQNPPTRVLFRPQRERVQAGPEIIISCCQPAGGSSLWLMETALECSFPKSQRCRISCYNNAIFIGCAGDKSLFEGRTKKGSNRSGNYSFWSIHHSAAGALRGRQALSSISLHKTRRQTTRVRKFIWASDTCR